MEVSLLEIPSTEDGSLKRFVIKVGQRLWPWPEKRLAVLVCCLAAADYASTVGFLKLAVDKGAYEAGVLAGRAVAKAGLSGLLLNDIVAISTLLLAAVLVRRICLKSKNNQRFSHAVFVFTLMPYVATVTAVILNNLFIILA